MKNLKPLLLAAAVSLFAFSGCEYEVPITRQPSHNVNESLLGDWASPDGKEKMTVRSWDPADYAVWYNGDLFRAFHSEAAGMDFVNVQMLETNNRKYSYVAWRLSADNQHLWLRTVSSKVVPKEIKDPIVIQQLLKENLKKPELFNEEQEFLKRKTAQ